MRDFTAGDAASQQTVERMVCACVRVRACVVILGRQRGGTGFAGSGVRLEATKYNPAMRSY